MIQAKVVADSIGPNGDRITSLEVVFPRYILAEKNTHRVMSKNSASSRAIPLRKMLLEAIHRPFIPYAFQKDHRGMQGTEYFSKDEKFSLADFMDKAKEFIVGTDTDESMDLYVNIINQYKHKRLTLEEWWLLARDKAVEMVAIMGIFGVTKQLANRLLEPFMYHKVLVTATEWENFFNLRCPQYDFIYEENPSKTFKSRKDFMEYYEEVHRVPMCSTPDVDKTLEWLSINKGQADIHMMFLAEAIYDAINESTPQELKAGEWHIPYSVDARDENQVKQFSDLKRRGLVKDGLEAQCKISIARCARLSYQTLGDNPEINYEKDLELYETLSTSGHWSPFEHVARVMTNDEYKSYFRQEGLKSELGWCRNFRGFIQYRELLD